MRYMYTLHGIPSKTIYRDQNYHSRGGEYASFDNENSNNIQVKVLSRKNCTSATFFYAAIGFEFEHWTMIFTLFLMKRVI